MKKTTIIKLEEAIANADNFILQMQQMDDKKLAKHLDVFRAQMAMAYKQKNDAAFQLLAEYEKQVIAARLTKC